LPRLNNVRWIAGATTWSGDWADLAAICRPAASGFLAGQAANMLEQR
jgi:hypothetical protein